MQSRRMIILIQAAIIGILLLVLRPVPLPMSLMESWNILGERDNHDNPIRKINALQEILRFNPDRVDLWLSLADEAEFTGDLNLAISALEKADLIQPLETSRLFLLADLYSNVGLEEKAGRVWKALASRNDLTEHDYFRLIISQRTAGNFNQAREYVEEWVNHYSTSGRANFIGGVLFASVDLERARLQLQAASGLDSAYQVRAYELSRTIQLALKSDDPAYQQVVIGRELAKLEMWDLAEEALIRAVYLAPKSAEAWAFLSQAQEQQGGDGKPALEWALLLSPDSIIVQASAAAYWRDHGQYDQALAYLEGLCKLEPESGVWQVELGRTYMQMGLLDQALNHYLAAIELEPKNISFWQALAMFSFNSNIQTKDIGLPAVRKALELGPADSTNLDVMGWGLMVVGDTVNAEKFLLQSVQKDEGNVSGWLHLGQLYIQLNKTSDARQVLTRAVEIAEGNSVGLVAENLLKEVGSQ